MIRNKICLPYLGSIYTQIALIHSISYACIRSVLLMNQILEQCLTLFNHDYDICSFNISLHNERELPVTNRAQLEIKIFFERVLFNNCWFLVITELCSSDGGRCIWTNYDRSNRKNCLIHLTDYQLFLSMSISNCGWNSYFHDYECYRKCCCIWTYFFTSLSHACSLRHS